MPRVVGHLPEAVAHLEAPTNVRGTVVLEHFRPLILWSFGHGKVCHLPAQRTIGSLLTRRLPIATARARYPSADTCRPLSKGRLPSSLGPPRKT